VRERANDNLQDNVESSDRTRPACKTRMNCAEGGWAGAVHSVVSMLLIDKLDGTLTRRPHAPYQFFLVVSADPPVPFGNAQSGSTAQCSDATTLGARVDDIRRDEEEKNRLTYHPSDCCFRFK
jgi:hypothetical protein